MSELKLSIRNSFHSLEHLREAWDEAVVALDGSIYMSYDWCKTWWDFYGTNKDLRIFLFFAGDSIIGIVPIYIDQVGFGPLKIRIARLVGSNIPPKIFNPPIHIDWSERIFESVLAQLLEKDSCDVLSFGPISETYKPLGGLEKICGGDIAIGDLQVVLGVHSIFWLPVSMDQYSESLSKNARKNWRKYDLRTLKKEYHTKVDIVSDAEQVEKEFENFVQQHTQYWNSQGKLGHFKAWPKAMEFNRSLVKAQGKLGRVRFIRILANDQVIASQFSFAFGDSYFWELPAHIVGEEWDRFSLGSTGLVQMIGVAITEGKKRITGGLAHYDYKVRLNATEYVAKTLRVVAKRSGSGIQMTIFGLLRFCLLTCYLKIWYRKICPRLPSLFWKPIWSIWLRLDF